MAAILEFRNLTKAFEGLVAVDNLSFELGEGEILGLIGPNGAGKTTVVSLISGTLKPTSGDVLFHQRPISRLAPFRRAHLGIGRTFQIMKPFPGLDVRDNVAVGALFGSAGRHRRLDRAREEAERLLEFVDLGHRAGQRADDLGGPDRKRLELAKALAMKPRLLLLDEVMAGLNHAEVDLVVETIRKVRAMGISILVIEHVMRAITSLSDRVLVLHHGQKLAEGAPGHVLKDPQVVEAYLGKRRA
jgi:branched-chain amino acid transport system ATP-binding protein